MLGIYLLIVLVAGISAKSDVVEQVPRDFSVPDEVLSVISENIAQKFEAEYLSFLKTGIESRSLYQLSQDLAALHSKKDIFTKEVEDLSRRDQFFMCTTCRAVAKVAHQTMQEDGELGGPDAEELLRYITLEICRRLRLQSEEVCSGLFESNFPVVQYIVQNTEIDSRSFCWLFMGIDMCSTKNPAYDFQMTIDKSKDSPSGPKSDVPKSGKDDVVILQITDIHHDPLYEPGSLAECDEPLCCQRNKTIYEGTSKAAGYWGDYRDCDAPWQLVENALVHIKKTHPKIDYIYHTGDVIDHMVWETSMEKNKEVLTKLSNAIEEAFPGIPVFPCIGNHEPHPLNAFSPSDVPMEVSSRWLYEHLYNDWSRWLPADTKETILEGGYYTVSPKPGFRIIALNNNVCYNMNWWMFYSGTDKIPQLQWLHDTLLEAEEKGELVHILTHIPTGSGSCWNTWAREYNRIIERFSDTISGLFNGHSHKDEMNVHYSSKGHAIAISWNGGSLTPASNKNPNYKVFQLTSDTMEVFDHETWLFNLTEANVNGKDVEPNWFKEYVFSEAFTKDLSPNGIDKLLDEFAENPEELRKFWLYRETSADPIISNGCSRDCLMSVICRIAMTVSDQRNRCIELQLKLGESLDKEPTTTASPEGPTTAQTTTENPGGGASSMASMQIITLLSVLALIKYLLQ